MDHYLERVIDLTDAAATDLLNVSAEEARARVQAGDSDGVSAIQGSFAIVARDGKTVRMARSLDRPLRYFLAKFAAGPALVVADRIDTIHAWLVSEGIGDQFHPSYTRMVPAHYIVAVELVGCPDPDPTYTRFLIPDRNSLQADVETIGRAYIGTLAAEIDAWVQRIPSHEPVGVCFSGGIDSGAVFLTLYDVLRKAGLPLSRLKAFTLSSEESPDLPQAREFLNKLGLALFHEPIEIDKLDLNEAIEVVEDYKPLDIECAMMGLALCRGIRTRYPAWRFLLDGDGGDENLKDYPIEENPELTIRSVVHNTLLYQEGWGVGKIKHSLTYSGGLSRSYTRTYAPGRRYGFHGFSPFTRPSVVAVAEAIPFIALTNYDVERLYQLKGEIVSHGVRAVTGLEMPVFPKRRFQHGAIRPETLRPYLPTREAEYRRQFLARYA